MSNNKGIAIFISLMLLFLLSLGVIAVLLAGYNYTRVTDGQIKRLKAIASAEAGLHYAYYQLRNNTITNFYPNKLGEANADTSLSGMNGLTEIKVWVEDLDPPVSGKYIIKSKTSY